MSGHDEDWEYDDAAPGDEHEGGSGFSQFQVYLLGLLLAVGLTVASFWLAGSGLVWGPGIPAALLALAVAPTTPAQESKPRVYENRLTPLRDPKPILADHPEWVEPVREVARFEAEPFFAEAIRVREWDDRGKIAGLKTAGMLEYRTLLEDIARAAVQ